MKLNIKHTKVNIKPHQDLSNPDLNAGNLDILERVRIDSLKRASAVPPHNSAVKANSQDRGLVVSGSEFTAIQGSQPFLESGSVKAGYLPPHSNSQFRSNNLSDIFPTEKKSRFQMLALFGLVISVFVFTAGIIFWQRSQVLVLANQCEEAVESATQWGFNSATRACPTKRYTFGIPHYFWYRNQVSEVEKSLAVEENNLLQEISSVDNKITSKLTNLAILEVDTKDLNEPVDSVNLYETLTAKKSYLEDLKNKEGDNLFKLARFQEAIKNTLTVSRLDIDKSRYDNFLKEFESLETDQKIAAYDNLKTHWADLQQDFGQELGQPSEGFYTFEPNSFRDLFDSMTLPDNIILGQEKPGITGDEAADAKIQSMAEARGYVLRTQVQEDVLVEAGEGFTLHPSAQTGYLNMLKAAKAEGVDMRMSSGYRSVDDQRKLFLKRLRDVLSGDELLVDTNKIAAGEYDKYLNIVLEKTAPPGYSKHHTGYAVDLIVSTSVAFEDTPAFAWLSANNYEKAKTFGFIPSYPDGATNQGPRPESWEYVWVGTDSLEVE